MFARLILAGAVALAPIAAQAAARIQEVVSPGGITAWLVQEPAIPIVSLDISFDGGAVLDPAGKVGAANLLGGMLLHMAIDLLQSHLGVGYPLLFPFSTHAVELGLIGSEATVPLALPLAVLAVWVWRRGQPADVPSAESAPMV